MGGKSEKISQSRNFKQVELTKPRYPIRVCRAFLRIRNIWYTSKADLSLLLKNEQKAIKVLDDTVEKTTDDHYSVGILWKEHRPVLPFNRDLAIMRLKFLENKFKRDPEFYKSYKNTVKDYINKGHTSKLLLEELKQTPPHTNFIPHHGVKM